MNKKGKILLFLFTFFYVDYFSFGQNLVLNGDFEDTLCCPTGTTTAPCASFWHEANGPSPDFYHTCASSFYPTQLISKGLGNGAGGLWNFYKDYAQCENIQGTLSQSLITGHTYCMTFLILVPNIEGNLVSDGIGVGFSPTLVDTPVSNFEYLPVQILNPSGNIYNDTANWSTFSGGFIAQGGEQYFIIGNFRTSIGSTQYDTIGSTFSMNQGYIFIDNVVLIDCTDTSSVVEIPSLNFEIYPNPANEYLTVQCPDSNVSLYIFDVLGQNVKQVSMSQGKNEVSVSHLAAGVYLVRYKDLVKKIIIER